DPFDRLPELPRRERDREFLGINAGLGPETAADMGRDNADAALVEADPGGKRAPHHVGRLRRAEHRELAGERVLGRDDAAALHGMTPAAGLKHALAKH